MLGVPLLREGAPIGIIVLMRRTVRPFTEKQIELATTFADQAVIAIENVRLFDEVRARTRELAQSVQELQALGEVSQAVNSTLDLETVLATIVAKAVQLSGTEGGAIYVFDELEQLFRLRATYGFSEDLVCADQWHNEARSIAGLHSDFSQRTWRLVTNIGGLLRLFVLGCLTDRIGRAEVLVLDRRNQVLSKAKGGA